MYNATGSKFCNGSNFDIKKVTRIIIVSWISIELVFFFHQHTAISTDAKNVCRCFNDAAMERSTSIVRGPNTAPGLVFLLANSGSVSTGCLNLKRIFYSVFDNLTGFVVLWRHEQSHIVGLTIRKCSVVIVAVALVWGLCLSVCLCLCDMITSKTLTYEVHFWSADTGQVCIWKPPARS